MQESRRVLRVFLASPTDVSAERAVADEVVSSVNRKIGRLIGWEIDLYKWEDKTPGFGRPQEIINSEMLDNCGLFIGLLWKKWGQPTGKYSSGFEEEFERARARRKAQGEPELWLFFKMVDSDSLKDSGPQLSKVTEFRTSQIAAHEVLFQDVQDVEKWRTSLFEGLSEYLLKLSISASAAQSQSSAAAPALSTGKSETSEIALRSVANGTEGIPQQLKDVSSLLSEVIQSGKLEFSREDASLLQEFDVARLYLLSATWMSRRSTGEILGTHEMNLLYKHRRRLELSAAEKFQLLRTLIGSVGDLLPGWFWFRELTPQEIKSWLIILASRESEGIRARALETLASAGIGIAKNAWHGLPLHDESSEVRRQAYEYLVRVGDRDALAFLDTLQPDGQDLPDDEIRMAKFKLLARLDTPKALADAITNEEYVSDYEIRILEKGFSGVDEEVLLKGVKSSSERIRKLSLQELTRRNRVPVPIATELTHDPSVGLRAIAFESLAKTGVLPDFGEVRKRLSEEDPSLVPRKTTLSQLMFGRLPSVKPDADSIIVTFYRTRSVDFLLEAADWYSIDGPLAYRALILDHYEQFSSQLRAELLDGFSRIKQISFERRIAKYGSEAWQEVAPSFDKYDESTRRDFARSALIGIAAGGRPADAELARPYLSDSDIFLRDAARSVICKFGGPEDLDELRKIATDSWGDIRRSAASAVLRVSPTFETACELTKNSDASVQSIGFDWMFSQNLQEARDFFLAFFHDENSTNRMRAIRYYSRWAAKSELEEFLEAYTTGETYYYDVVTWLDRLVYSPSPLREMFVRDLADEADDGSE
jgi:hypothetical protein